MINKNTHGFESKHNTFKRNKRCPKKKTQIFSKTAMQNKPSWNLEFSGKKNQTLGMQCVNIYGDPLNKQLHIHEHRHK